SPCRAVRRRRRGPSLVGRYWRACPRGRGIHTEEAQTAPTCRGVAGPRCGRRLSAGGALRAGSALATQREHVVVEVDLDCVSLAVCEPLGHRGAVPVNL